MREIIVKNNNIIFKIQIIEITSKTVAFKNLDSVFESIKRVTKEEFNEYEIIEEC